MRGLYCYHGDHSRWEAEANSRSSIYMHILYTFHTFFHTRKILKNGHTVVNKRKLDQGKENYLINFEKTVPEEKNENLKGFDSLQMLIIYEYLVKCTWSLSKTMYIVHRHSFRIYVDS